MSLKSTAQNFSPPVVVLEEVLDNNERGPEEILVNEPQEVLIEECGHEDNQDEIVIEDSKQPLEVVLEIEFDGKKDGILPGAPDSEDPLEVLEDSLLEVEEKKEPDKDQNDAKKSKKSEKWDWESKGAEGFVAWVKERFENVPKHSGYDTAGLERAVSYLERLDSEISKAMRLDIEGELDANLIEEVRSKIEDGIDKLYERLDKIKKNKKNKRKKSDYISDSLIKEAQKITGVKGIYIIAPLFISRIARVCINGTVSAGHDISDMFNKQKKKWNLTDREQVEVMQLLSDMGYPLREDRGYLPDEEYDTSSSDNFDFMANYKG